MSDALMTPGLRKRLEQVEKRYDELGTLLSSPEVTSDPNRIRQFGQELSSLTAVVDAVRTLRASEARVKEARSSSSSTTVTSRTCARGARVGLARGRRADGEAPVAARAARSLDARTSSSSPRRRRRR